MRVTMDGERIVPGIDEVWSQVDVLVCNSRFLGKASGREKPREGA